MGDRPPWARGMGVEGVNEFSLKNVFILLFETILNLIPPTMYVSGRLVEILISIFILATTPLVAHIHSFTSLGSVQLDTLEALLDGGHFSQFTRLVLPVLPRQLTWRISLLFYAGS
jgi:hypothetical protein